ncbi:MAG TPA: helix-turn-helix domain-containing protein [Lactobacillaceae bacterium]|jgi:hypothetical protein
MAKPVNGLSEAEAFQARVASGFVTTKDAQTMTGVVYNTLMNWVKDGKLHKYVNGTTVRFSVDEIRALYVEQGV